MSEKVCKGSCLCGEVEYEITGNMGVFQYCHCSRCRKFTGSAHGSNLFVKPEQFRWTKGEEMVGYYELPEAKYFATSFCKQCGSSLPWLSRSGRVYIVTAGTLDDDPEMRPTQSIYWESRAPWHIETGELPKHDEMPPRQS